MTLDEFLAAIDDKLPPAPLSSLDQFESHIGQRLPEDYREFLVRCNGGYAAGAVAFQGPTPEGRSADACPNHIGGFREESHFSLMAARENYQPDEVRIPKTLLWIMDDPLGNAICVGLTGSHRGRVYFWDHENEPDPETWDGEVETAGNIDLLANSFTAFVAGLHHVEKPAREEPSAAPRDERTPGPAFHVDRVLLSGLIPIARYYTCIYCGHDLTDWIMTQSINEPSLCPNCEIPISERDIARAQRDTKLGCLWTLLSIACLLLGFAAVVGVVWLLTGPRPLIRFR
jgi:hypothetical protein